MFDDNSVDAYGRTRVSRQRFVDDVQAKWAGGDYDVKIQDDTVHLRLNCGGKQSTVILDERFYSAVLKNLLVVLTVEDGKVFLSYPKQKVKHWLARVVVARLQDYWSVKLKSDRDWFESAVAMENAKLRGVTPTEVLDYRASNILVERAIAHRVDTRRLAEEAKRNLVGSIGKDGASLTESQVTKRLLKDDYKERVFQIGGKLVHQLFDAGHVLDKNMAGHTGVSAPDKPNRPKGQPPDGNDDFADVVFSSYRRGEVQEKGEEIGTELRPSLFEGATFG